MTSFFVNEMNENFNASHLKDEKSAERTGKWEWKEKIFMKIWKTLAIMHILIPHLPFEMFWAAF